MKNVEAYSGIKKMGLIRSKLYEKAFQLNQSKKKAEAEAEVKDIRYSYAVENDASAPEQQADRKSLFGNLQKRGTLFGN